ncbi:MAG: Uncharacterized protein G01um101416_852 [Microgenomates group bacterium Gr01-1014_16]|nr:MAG: Uncharacterized protein G01um101416_852 [Microgenomates group bacterium Gr01-1014_16]
MPIVFALILTFLSLYLNPIPRALPVNFKNILQPTVTPASKIVIPEVVPDSDPWGVAKKIGEHTYRIKVQNDTQMGTPEEILLALNNLRVRNNVQTLKTDARLCSYAQERAVYQNKLGKTDAHAGFEDYLQNQDGFRKLGFGRVGENSSYGYILSGVHLIEFVYMQSPEHNKNQLDPAWDYGCVGTFGLATNLIFATSPL